MHASPKRPVTRAQLGLVHSNAYLDSLREPAVVARAVELEPVKRMPAWAVSRYLLRPMRWATQGTIVAGELTLQAGFVVNLGGGYHHAKPDHGEGFCLFSDIGVMIQHLRLGGALRPDARVVYVDTDAHQGNGVCHVFVDDPSAFIFDIFNDDIYPYGDITARRRIDCEVLCTSATDDASYLDALRTRFPDFLDALQSEPIELAIYNAGTDVLNGDPLGAMQISRKAIAERDQFVVSELRRRQIPTVMLLSGGYTRESYQVIADSIAKLIRVLD